MTQLLSDLLPKYFAANIRIRKQETRTHYERTLRQFGKFLGHAPTTDDLTDDTCTAFMLWTMEQGLTEVTANQRCKQLRALWTWAAKRRIVEAWPTFQDVEEPETQPQAWTPQQLAALFKTCAAQKGWIGPMRADLFWLALHCVLLDTAERIAATVACRWDWFDAEQRTLSIPAKVRKGGKKSMVYLLTERTCGLLEQIRYPVRDLIFDVPFDGGAFYHRYKRLIASAGLPTPRGKCGPHRMRVTVLTLIESYGGDATAFARHSSRQTTDESYIDQKLTLALRKRVWPREDFQFDAPKRGLLTRLFGKAMGL